LALSLGAVSTKAADALLAELAMQAGARPYVADAIVSSASGRELGLLLRLSEAPEKARAETAPVLASLAAAILRSQDIKSTEQLLALLDPNREWLNDAIIGGVERFIPGGKGRERTVFLPSEPRSLIAFAKGSSVHAARARDALEFIRWQGQQIDPERAAASLTAVQREWFERGRKEFVVCAACHQPNGEGQEGLAPPLVGSRWAVGGADALVRIVVNGKTRGSSTMPPLNALDDETIASILTYIRRAWGHASYPISPDQVRYIRGQ